MRLPSIFWIQSNRHSLTRWCVCSVMSASLRPHGLQPARLLCPLNFPSKTREHVAVSFSRGPIRPRDLTRVSCISCIGRWIDNFTTAPLGKPLTLLMRAKMAQSLWETKYGNVYKSLIYAYSVQSALLSGVYPTYIPEMQIFGSQNTLRNF